jgi:hypothetical protein
MSSSCRMPIPMPRTPNLLMPPTNAGSALLRGRPSLAGTTGRLQLISISLDRCSTEEIHGVRP